MTQKAIRAGDITIKPFSREGPNSKSFKHHFCQSRIVLGLGGHALSELSEASKCALVISQPALKIVPLVAEVGQASGPPSVEVIFKGGADFSLVGTIGGSWTGEQSSNQFGHSRKIIGRVEGGQGVWLEAAAQKPLLFRGWNYFVGQS